ALTQDSPIYLSQPTPPSQISTLSLHDALPICCATREARKGRCRRNSPGGPRRSQAPARHGRAPERSSGASAAWADTASDIQVRRSEEHTSELQSRENLVCRLLLEKKNTTKLLQ